MSDTTTIEIDKETHALIRQYCLLTGVKVKQLIREWAEQNLSHYKKKIDEMKKLGNHKRWV